MKQRVLTLALTAGCIIMGGIAFLVYTGQDHKDPKIIIEDQKISYTEGERYEVLLEGVSAKDNRDGDVTEEVFVDKVVPAKEGYATVYYGVTDSSNNVGTARRTIAYTATPDKEQKKTTNNSEVNSTEKMQEEEAEEPKDEDSSDAEDEELKPDGERPAIELTQTEVTIKKGESFDPLSVIKQVVDDKDDRDTLYQRISADGERNTNKTGTYSIRYYVKDSDGNTSEPKELTLTVE